jgi:hypothetical protein
MSLIMNLCDRNISLNLYESGDYVVIQPIIYGGKLNTVYM